MSAYRLVAEPAVDADVEAAFDSSYFAAEESTVVVLTVLHAHRDPAVWQERGG